MGPAADINAPIIEALYAEALVLADETRAAFDLAPLQPGEDPQEPVRLAHSTEGLRTTTRVMHVLAWLLNHRAHLAGELSEFQLRRHGSLPADRAPEGDNISLLPPHIANLIGRTQAIHRRVWRLDQAWRARFAMEPSAISRLRERLGEAVYLQRV